jgi:hypothetical protein
VVQAHARLSHLADPRKLHMQACGPPACDSVLKSQATGTEVRAVPVKTIQRHDDISR